MLFVVTLTREPGTEPTLIAAFLTKFDAEVFVGARNPDLYKVEEVNKSWKHWVKIRQQIMA